MDSVGNRKFERTDFNVKGFVNCDGRDYPVSVINISLKGVLVSAEDSTCLKLEQKYPLRISLPHSEINIITTGRLMRKDDGHYGFRFDSIEADGMIHLRRLLELNISSEEEIERELSFLNDQDS